MGFFSPLRDQPQRIYTLTPGADGTGMFLRNLERIVPGCFTYGHYHGDWSWYRLKKETNEDLDGFGYYKVYTPTNCAWITDNHLLHASDRLGFHISTESHQEDGIFPWPDEEEPGADEDLATMAEYGRHIVDGMVEDGIVKPFVTKLLTDYQARGVYWAATRPWSKLVYPCGAGKTLTAILASLTCEGTKVVVCPAKARRVWWDQVQQYTTLDPYRVVPVGQLRKRDRTLEQYLDETENSKRFLVVGMQLLADKVELLTKLRPRVLVIDEIHQLGQSKRWKPIFTPEGEVEFEKRKTAASERAGSKVTRETQAVAAMDVSRIGTLQRRIGLTATPLADGRPRRLWAPLDLLSPGGFSMGYGAFADRYCDAVEGSFGGRDDKGSSNVQELKDRCRYLLHEVTHTESHGQLPATRVQVVYLDAQDQCRPAAFMREMRRLDKITMSTGLSEDKERSVEIRLQEAASRKRKYVVDEVVEGLRGGGKVVLFTARRQDAEDWSSFVGKAMEREAKKGFFDGKLPDLWWGHGGISERDRGDMVAAFREHPGPCVLIGTGQAFGESVDGLQTADLAIFSMLPWRPGDFEQWKGRFDRLGGRATLLKVIVARGTYDEQIAGVLADKIVPITEFLAAEQYEGLGDKLLGIEDRERVRMEIISALFPD